MRAVWLYPGRQPDHPKLAAAGIDSVYFDIRDPQLSAAYLADVRKSGLEVGVYAVSSWWPELTAAQFAAKTSSLLEQVVPTSPPDFPKVCLDIETKAVAFVLGALRAWRTHRPKRVTDWTLEGHQGGIFTPGQLLAIAGLVRYVVPQAYDANVQPWDAFAMALDLYEHGLPFPKIVPFLSAAHLLPWWQGYAFTQDQLP